MRDLQTHYEQKTHTEFYTTSDGWLMQREADAKWVLRDANSKMIDRDKYRTDLAQRNEMRFV